MKYILTLEKYIGYNDYKKGNWGTPSEIEEDVKSTINLILKPVSDKLKKVEFEDQSSDKGIKWEVKVNSKDILHFYKTTKWSGEYEIYLNKKESSKYEIQQFFLDKYLNDLERYISSMEGYDSTHVYSDTGSSYKTGRAHSKKLTDMYSKLSNSDKKKAHSAFVKKHKTDSIFKDFLGV
jgi:hypothetical protein